MTKLKHILFLNQLADEFQESKVFKISCQPLIETTPLPFDSSNWNKNIPWVFTSRTAVGLFQTNELPSRVYAIGPRTANTIPTAITPTIPTAEALAKLIISAGETEVLFICGETRRDALPKRLKEAQIKVTEEVVYRTQILQKNVDLQSVDGLAFMSPSSVVGMTQNGGFNNLPCFAIGPTTAQTLTEHGQEPILSTESSAESLIQSAQAYFNR
jgi:uroporphyrinogen-III synthase